MTGAKHAAAAARWYMELQKPDATPQTFVEWERWMSADSEHRAAYQGLDRMMRLKVDVMPRLSSPEELAADDYDASRPVSEWNAVRRGGAMGSFRRYAIAAGIAAVSVLAAGFWLGAHDRGQPETLAFQTSAGERRAFDLPDGSRITLDADSVLNVQLLPERRSLQLARGEAYLEVAKDAARPFLVRAGGTVVRAVGTAFDVRMSVDRTVVAVTEGKVEVRSEENPQADNDAANGQYGSKSSGKKHSVQVSLTAEVSAGAAVAYARNAGLRELPATEASLAATWLKGRRQYRNEPLRYVLADIDRYTGKQIVIVGESIGDLQFTGTLDLANSATWLKGLSVALPVTITESEHGQLSVQAR